MSSKPLVGLDADGVMLNFVKASCDLLGAKHAAVVASWPKDRIVYYIHEVLGVTEDEYWAKVDLAGVSFWANIEPYPWFDEMWRRLNEVAEVYFLTSPSWSAHAAAGKVASLQRLIHPRFDRFILTKHKHLFAAPGRFLIDDSDAMVDAFTAAGGTGILFPQLWNKSARTPDPATIVNDIVSLVCPPHVRIPLND